jgi:hypothetical protein
MLIADREAAECVFSRWPDGLREENTFGGFALTLPQERDRIEVMNNSG